MDSENVGTEKDAQSSANVDKPAEAEESQQTSGKFARAVDWCNQHGTAITAVATIGLSVATFGLWYATATLATLTRSYLLETQKLVKESQAQRELVQEQLS